MSGCHVQPEQMFNLVFGYNAIWAEDEAHLATGGDGTRTSDTVPVGEVWVLTHVSMSDTTRTAVNYFWEITDAGGLITRFLVQLAVDRYIVSRWDGWIALQAGEYVTLYYSGTALNDAMYGAFRGYKMKLTQ